MLLRSLGAWHRLHEPIVYHMVPKAVQKPRQVGGLVFILRQPLHLWQDTGAQRPARHHGCLDLWSSLGITQAEYQTHREIPTTSLTIWSDRTFISARSAESSETRAIGSPRVKTAQSYFCTVSVALAKSSDTFRYRLCVVQEICSYATGGAYW